VLRRFVGPVLAGLVVLVAATGCSDDATQGSSGTTAPAAAGGGGSTTTPPTVGEGGAGGDGSSVPATSLSPHGDLPAVDLSSSEQPYVDALLAQPHPGMDDEQAGCVAGRWVQVVGTDAIEAAGVTADGLRDGTSSISDVPMDRPTAESVVDAYETCQLDLVEIVVAGVSPSAGDDPAKVTCIQGVITPDVARGYMVLALMGAGNGPDSPELVQFQQLVEPCLR
jgi:hypothetical protein